MRLQRKRVFLGCEGKSEKSYGALLYQLLTLKHQRFHIASEVLKPGGGGALELIRKAEKFLERDADLGNEPFAIKAVLLDGDFKLKAPKQFTEATKLAAALDIRLIIQNPCHEAFLLRHLPGCEKLKPKSAKESIKKLIGEWPSYEKGQSALQLGLRINRDAIQRVSKVELEYKKFLDDLGFF